MENTIWKSDQVQWIDVSNPTHEDLRDYSDRFGLDYYTLADCLEPAHLPKKEQLREFFFLILRVYDQKAPRYPTTIQEMSKKIAIFFNDRILLTVHRAHSGIIGEVREKYLDTGLVTRPDEVVTRIMHYAVSSFEANAAVLSEDVDRIEKLLFTGRQTRISLRELYHVRSSARLCRRILDFTRNVVSGHSSSASDSSALQDVLDSLQKLTLSYDETHDDATNLSTVYLSVVSVKTNDAMKLLTVFSVFFMPLTFIAGIYGMNFRFMPELEWRWGYPLIMLLMVLISLGIFIWFKRKKLIP